MTDLQTILNDAVQRHRDGDLTAAAQGYRTVLRHIPAQPDALHLLGLVRLRQGRVGVGGALMRQAIACRPDHADWYCNLGHADLAAAGEEAAGVEAAVRRYGQALSLRCDQHAARQAQYQAIAARIRRDPRFDDDRPAGRRPGPAAIDPSLMVSIIICSVNPEKFRRVTANYAALFAGTAHEIIGIHDARSLCEGYQRGFARSRGEVILFSHDDVELLDDDARDRILTHMQSVDLLGFAGTTRLTGPSWFSSGWPHQYGFVIMNRPTADGPWRAELFGATPGQSRTESIQALDGLLMVARRSLVARIGFDSEIFDGFHLYDIDFSWRAAQAGCRVAVAQDIGIIHESTGNMDDVWQHYARRFLQKHAGTLSVAAAGPNPGRFAMLRSRGQLRAWQRALRALTDQANWPAALDDAAKTLHQLQDGTPGHGL
jgi:GT2 family glycosyltransferase